MQNGWLYIKFNPVIGGWGTQNFPTNFVMLYQDSFELIYVYKGLNEEMN